MSGSRKRLLLLVAAVVVALTAVGAAMTSTRRAGQAIEPTTSTTTVATEPPAAAITTTKHEFPAAYEGPVWVTIAVTDGREHDVEIVWGPWRKVLHQSRPGPVSFWFRKGTDPAAEPSPPVEIRADAGVTVTLAHGAEIPASAVDANAGWTSIPVESDVVSPSTGR